MNKKYVKPLIMIATLGVTATSIYYAFKWYKRKKASDSTDKKDQEISVTTAPSGIEKVVGDFPLKRGSKNPRVETLQVYLNNQDKTLPQLKVDGIFGIKTEKKLIKVTGKKQLTSNEFANLFNQKSVMPDPNII